MHLQCQNEQEQGRQMWKRFVKDFTRYFSYARYSARSDLKAEVASSYLNWLWWILDPLLFMLVYSFIAVIVFNSTVQYFPCFVFIGLTLWDFFNKTSQGSVKLMRQNSSTITKVYLPKYFLVLSRCMVFGFKMLVSSSLILIMMLFYRVPLTWRVVFIIPILVIEGLLTFGFSCIVMHFGVFVDDLYNVVLILLRLTFYMSGIFYSIDGRLGEPYRTLLLSLNPMAMLIQSARQCVLYATTPSIGLLCVWGVIALILSIIGIRLIYGYENSYVKVM